MNKIFFAFAISLVLALALTPLAKRLGNYLGAIDKPGERKIHTGVIPRAGGPAILVSFFLALYIASLLSPGSAPFFLEKSYHSKWFFGILGAIVVFGVGFVDDCVRLGPFVKLFAQIVAASLAFLGGLRIETFVLGGMEIQFGFLSYFVTLFWFLLFINAVNLIDGLDGLAAGVAFFAAVAMTGLTAVQGDYLTAMAFAAIGGALLGFLRYNFNPASIFLGDGGSYLVGYVIAALAIFGSIKSQLWITMLIPLLALGVPVFDAILSPLRRFVLGRGIFDADKEHVHHRLLQMGLTTRRAVTIIYGVTLSLCLFALLLVNLRDASAGLALLILTVLTFLSVRKLGYLEYLAVDKFSGWLLDVSETSGMAKGRRSFLGLQIDIENSRDMEELWKNVCRAMEALRFDYGELHLGNGNGNGAAGDKFSSHKKDDNGQIWRRTHDFYRGAGDCEEGDFLKIELPLGYMNGNATGRLILLKDTRREPMPPYMLRRVELMRRAVTNSLKNRSNFN